MSRLLSSARTKRRLLWLAGFAGLAGVIAILIVVIKNPPPPAAEKTEPGGVLVKPDVKMAFGPHSEEILGVAQQFVLTAVRRRNVDDSWDMVCPELREGYTRAAWAKGDIPVVPYPAVLAKWHLSYSFQSEVDLQVGLYAKPEKKLAPVVFDLTLHPCGGSSSNRWRVSSFLPTPSPSGNFGGSGGKSRYGPVAIGTLSPDEVYQPKKASGFWLFIPLGITFAMLLTAVGIVVMRSYRGRKVYNDYVRARRLSSR